MGSVEFNMRWKLFINGLVQALYSGAVASLAVFVVNGAFSLAMPPAAIGMTVAGIVIAHLIGYFQRSPLPPVFDVDDEITKED